MSKTIRLTELPPEVLKIVLRYAIGTPSPELLDEITFENFWSIFPLCMSNFALFSALQAVISSLNIRRYSPTDTPLYELFASFCATSQAMNYLSISAKKPSTYKLLKALSKVESNFSYISICKPFQTSASANTDIIDIVDIFADFLLSCKQTLRALRFQKCFLMSREIVACTPAIGGLKTLALQDVRYLGHRELIALVSVPGSGLRELILGNVFCSDVSDLTLFRIGQICSGLESVLITRCAKCTGVGVRDLAMLTSNTMQCVDTGASEEIAVKKVHMTKEDILAVTKTCRHLKRISVNLNSMNLEDLVSILKPAAKTLQLLRLVRTNDTVPFDKAQFIQLEDTLISIRSLLFHGLSGKWIPDWCHTFGSRLCMLHVHLLLSTVVIDDILRAIGNCKSLTRLHMSVEKTNTGYQPKVSSIAVMLQGIGQTLKYLFCDCFDLHVETEDYQKRNHLVHVRKKARRAPLIEDDSPLNGLNFAGCVRTYCKSLSLLSIQGLEEKANNYMLPHFEILRRRMPSLVISGGRTTNLWITRYRFCINELTDL